MDNRLQILYVDELKKDITKKIEENGYKIQSINVDANLNADGVDPGIHKIYLSLTKKQVGIEDINKVEINVNNKNKIFEAYGRQTFDAKAMFEEYKKYAEILKPHIIDTITLLHNAIESGKKVLCEGAQASLLDIDFGSYPFVTSSNPTIGGVCTGSGIGAKNIGEVYGVIKAYASRVGSGPFVTEQNNEIGDTIRELGHEYGVTTKRPRRCGWLDLVALKYVVRLNGLTGLAINHVDTIGKLPKIKVCVGYNYNGKVTTDFTTNVDFLTNSTAVYEEFDGNFGDISHCKTRKELPENAQKYLNRIEEFIGIPIKFIGTGAGREAMIIE